MKRFLFIFVILFGFSTSAVAAEPWSTQDIVLEGVYLGLLVIDLGQSIYSSKSDLTYESNPFIQGFNTKHDKNINLTRDEFYAIAITTAAMQLTTAHFVPKYRTLIIGVSVIIELYAVIFNAQQSSIGFNLAF